MDLRGRVTVIREIPAPPNWFWELVLGQLQCEKATAAVVA
jgi:hypothetical protein